MSRERSKIYSAMPAMDVSRIALQFKQLVSSQTGAPSSASIISLSNADIFMTFRDDIMAARKLGLGWQEIADELARAGVHKKNGVHFAGSEIRIYTRRKLKPIEGQAASDLISTPINTSEFPSQSSISRDLSDAVKHAEILPSALQKPAALTAVGDAALRIFMRIDAISSSRMDGLRPSLEDLLELEARGVGRNAMGRKRSLISASCYVDALERFIPVVRQAGRAGLTPRLMRELQEALIVQSSVPPSADNYPAGNKVSGCGKNIGEACKPIWGLSEKNIEQISSIARGDKFSTSAPALARIAVSHALYDAAWPFDRGSGRAGRLFLTLTLAAYDFNYVLISNVIEARKTDYNNALRRAQQEHKWDLLIQLLCDSIVTAAHQAEKMIQALHGLPALWKSRSTFRKGSAAQRALDILPYNPLITAAVLAKILNVNATAANRAMGQLVKEGIVIESKGRKQGRVYSVSEALQIISRSLIDIRTGGGSGCT